VTRLKPEARALLRRAASIGHTQRLPDLPPETPYAAAEVAKRPFPARGRSEPSGYVVVAISTYPDELSWLDAVVERLKQSGAPAMSRSRLIRIALRQLDLELLVAEVNR
jgi:hypothetical protein